MIIITSEVVINPKHWQAALAQTRAHVEASRREPGCISHRFLISPEIENCLFFYEEWRDRAAIDHHFKQDYSRAISKNLTEWAMNKVKINFHLVLE